MTSMVCVLIRLPASLLAEIDQLVDETYTNRSAFIRQACSRHCHIISQVELPFIREFYRKRIPNPDLL